MSYYSPEPDPETKTSAIVFLAIVVGIVVFIMLIGCTTVRASTSLHPMRLDDKISSYVVREKGHESTIVVGSDDRPNGWKEKNYE